MTLVCSLIPQVAKMTGIWHCMKAIIQIEEFLDSPMTSVE